MKRLLLIILFISTLAFADDKVILEADQIETPQESIYHAIGNVKIFQNEKTLTADEAFYNKEENTIRAVGNVVFTEPDSRLTCEELTYSPDSEKGKFINVKAFSQPYHYLTAGILERLNSNSFIAKDTTFTTCGGDSPDWSFKAGTAKADIGGYLRTTHTTGRIKDFPVLYTPYMIYPIKTERESGFLVPDFGYSSKMGAYITPKYYWNIDVDQDLTFTAAFNSMERPLYFLEHRYTPNKDSSIYSYFEYTAKEKRYPANEDGSYELKKDTGRYFVYMDSNVQFSKNIALKADVDFVSDYEYLDDYGKFSQLDGYENDTDEYTVDVALQFNSKYADLDIRYINDMEYSVGSYYIKENTYAAPSISVYENVTALPVYLRYKASYDKVRYTKYSYRYNNDTASETDFRYDREHLRATFYRPVNLYIGTLTPSVTLYQTRWHDFEGGMTMPDDYSKSSFAKITSGDDYINRTEYKQVHTFKLNEIYRTYGSFKHSIYNKLVYTQTPFMDNTGLPEYIAEDTITNTKDYTYTLENVLKGSKWYVSLSNSIQDTLLEGTDYNDSYTNELKLVFPNIQINTKHTYDTTNHKHEYMNFSTTLEAAPFSMTGSYTYDRDDENANDNNTSAELELKYSTNKYDVIYTRSIEGLNTTITTANLDDTVDNITFLYKKECWNISIEYERESNPKSVEVDDSDKVEHSVMFKFSLKGLGSSKTSDFRQ